MTAGSPLIMGARLAAWLVLVAVGAFAAPESLGLAAGAVAFTIGAITLGGTVASIWRGPPVVWFAAAAARRCDEREAEPVRAYARLRGTMGGAGHVHPPRLLFPALTWAAALLAGGLGVTSGTAQAPGQIASAVAAVAAVGCWLFPSRPYWYREVMGGGAVVWPPEVVAALVARELSEGEPGIAAVRELGRADPILLGRPGAGRSASVEPPQDPAWPHAGGASGRASAARERRAPRYRVARDLVVVQGGRPVEVATIDVSEAGLAVSWPRALPAPGERVVVRLENGAATSELEAVVSWCGPGPEREQAVGLSLGSEAPDCEVWRTIVHRAARSEAYV